MAVCRLPGLFGVGIKRNGGNLPGRIWKRRRSTGVFDVDLFKRWEDEEDEEMQQSMYVEQFKKYYEAFRMRPHLFDKLVELLQPFVAKDSTQMRETVPTRKRVAVGIQRLATTKPCIDIGWTHQLGKSTVENICKDVNAGLCALMPNYITFPTGDR